MKNLTRKVGPLPLWAYAVILGGTFLAYRMLRGGGQGQDASVQLIPTGAPPIDPSDGFLNELSLRLDRIEANQTAPPPASDDGSDDGSVRLDLIRGIRSELGKIREYLKTGTGGTIQPTPSGTSGPPAVSAKPTRISLATAQKILRDMGFRESLATSGAWIQSDAAAYVWRSPDTFRAWVTRTTRDNPAKYR